jgi:hypothetical protein
VQRREGVAPVGDLLLDAVELLLLRGGRLVGAPAHLGGVLLRLGVQRDDLLARRVAPLLDLRSTSARIRASCCCACAFAASVSRWICACAPSTSALAWARACPSSWAACSPSRLASCWARLPASSDSMRVFSAWARISASSASAAAAPLLVRLVLVRAAGAELGLELLAHLLGALAGVGERLLGVGLAAGRALGAARHDLGRLLLGQRQDLVDHRPEVAERRLVELDRRPLVQFAQFGLQLLQLGGHRLHLRTGPLTFRVERRQFGVDARHVLVDLALVVAPHHEVELRPLTAVGHAPSTLPAQPPAQRYRHRPADRHPRPGASFRRETARSGPVCGG